MDDTDERLDDASRLIADGKIAFIGAGNEPEGTTTIDAYGRWVTPGLIAPKAVVHPTNKKPGKTGLFL